MYDMVLKMPRYFYLMMEKPLGVFFWAWSPYYQVAHYNQKTPIPVDQEWETQKEISINVSHI